MTDTTTHIDGTIPIDGQRYVRVWVLNSGSAAPIEIKLETSNDPEFKPSPKWWQFWKK